MLWRGSSGVERMDWGGNGLVEDTEDCLREARRWTRGEERLLVSCVFCLLGCFWYASSGMRNSPQQFYYSLSCVTGSVTESAVLFRERCSY